MLLNKRVHLWVIIKSDNNNDKYSTQTASSKHLVLPKCCQFGQESTKHIKSESLGCKKTHFIWTSKLELFSQLLRKSDWFAVDWWGTCWNSTFPEEAESQDNSHNSIQDRTDCCSKLMCIYLLNFQSNLSPLFSPSFWTDSGH